MASSARDKPLPQSTPAAAYGAVPPSSYSTYYHHQQQPSAYYPPPPPPPPRPFTSTFLCRFLAGVAAVFTLFALIALITWLILKPRPPEFRVVSASVNSLNATGSDLLSAQWDIALVVTNPNHKLNLYYDSVSAGLFYWENRNRLLATTRYPPFVQHTRSENTLHVKFAVAEEFVGGDVARAIAGDRARGFVRFGVSLSAWLTFKSGIVRSSYHLWEVVCYPLNFDFPTPNNANGTLSSALNCENKGKQGCENCFYDE